MNVFNVIPIGFFNPLASGSNNKIYADCLQVIYGEYDREITFKMDRERLRDAVAAYLIDNHIESIADIQETSYSDIASQILRKLSSPEIGWLEEEIDGATYGRNIIMTEQGLMLADLLNRLEKPEKSEFSSYIYNIYNTLSNTSQWEEDIYVDVLLNVYKNAKGLSKDLKTLATFIKKIIERMIHEETFESLTENLLDYFNGDFIKEYSRLTKRQSIRTFRRIILQKLSELRREEIIERLIDGCRAEEKMTREGAEDRVEELISNTIRFLDSDYDRIMSDIKHKINVYLQVAVGRARFIRNKEENIRGDIEETIRIISEEMKNGDIRDEIPDEMRGLFTFTDNLFIDLSSISYPRRSQNIKENSLQEEVVITDEDIERTRAEFEKEIEDAYAKDKMAVFMKNITGITGCASAEDFPMEEKSELLRTLSAVSYAEENGFSIEPLEGYIETDKMLLRRFKVKRK